MSEAPTLANKVVIVTGAGGGVGEGIAKLAAARGAKVIVNDLGVSQDGTGSADGTPAQRVVDEIKAAGGEATASYRSVAEWDSAHAIIQDALDAYGRIDCVVNNAGILRDVIFHKMTELDWNLVRSVNLDACFYMARAAAPHFKAQESGSFIHMTSTSGLVGNLAQANYSAAKLGVVALSKSIAIDMERFGVRSNCIAPFGFTRMVNTIPETDEVNRRRLAWARKMTPDKVAPLAVALMMDEAKYVNGQVFSARMNELFLFSQPRPIRSAQTAEGWTPETVLSNVFPAFKSNFLGLDKSADAIGWEPW